MFGIIESILLTVFLQIKALLGVARTPCKRYWHPLTIAHRVYTRSLLVSLDRSVILQGARVLRILLKTSSHRGPYLYVIRAAQMTTGSIGRR